MRNPTRAAPDGSAGRLASRTRETSFSRVLENKTLILLVFRVLRFGLAAAQLIDVAAEPSERLRVVLMVCFTP